MAVQADQSEDETLFLLEHASANDFIKGVVGWIDLRAENVEERLEYFSGFYKLKGFRHVVQVEPEDDFLLRNDFCRGISFLGKYKFTYDILVFPKHLPYVVEFVKRFPEQPFVIDHLAKPCIKDKKTDEWKNDIKQLAQFPNVYCKLSGMVTEAALSSWAIDDFKPYINIVLESFGIDRVMFGSDWPVCLLAASYEQCCEVLEKNTEYLSADDKKKIWGVNAIQFYNL
jgi:L-fuconolactonase